MKKKRKFSISKCMLHITLILVLIIMLAPLVIVLSSSLREISNMKSPLVLFEQITFESYIAAFKKMNFWNSFMNSVITTFGSVIVIVIIASMAAYPIARIKNKTSRGLYYFFIAGLIIPAQMVIVPIAQMLSGLGISNNRFTPMIMFITCSLPFSTFLFVGFMKSIPVEIEEAAYLDGAGLIRRFTMIVFPLLKPATISVVITQGIWIWNDYFFPLIFTSKTSQATLPLSMLAFLGDKENPAQWNVLFASCILCAIPLIIAFIFLQKHFVSGVSAGSVKG